MMRHSTNHGDHYNHHYREPYEYRDYPAPRSYRERPVDPEDPSDYWDHQEYPEPSSRRNHSRQPAHFREPARRQAGGDPSSQVSGRPIGNQTNSDDFAAKDSRVFVGNLNTVTLSKEDVHGIFGRLGNVTGISMHKGYAFVQFSNPGEARRALALENGQVYAGQALDLNIVSQPKIKGAQKRSVEPPAVANHHRYPKPTVIQNRSAKFQRGPLFEEPPVGHLANKRPRPDGNPSMQRSNLVTLANNDHSASRLGPGGGGFRHEPREVGCAQCDAVFNSSWNLIHHFQQYHKVHILRATVNDGR